MDRGAWQATVHGVTKNQTRLKQLSKHTWTVALQAPLSMGFPRQEYWSVLPFPPPGDLPHPGTEHVYPVAPALADGFFTTEPSGKPLSHLVYDILL